jgi:hypothetical protein
MQSAPDVFKSFFDNQPEQATKEEWKAWTLASIAKLEAWKAEILHAAAETVTCGHGCISCTCVITLKTRILALGIR